jgi:hypothetical protein
MKLVAHDQ